MFQNWSRVRESHLEAEVQGSLAFLWGWEVTISQMSFTKLFLPAPEEEGWGGPLTRTLYPHSVRCFWAQWTILCSSLCQKGKVFPLLPVNSRLPHSKTWAGYCKDCVTAALAHSGAYSRAQRVLAAAQPSGLPAQHMSGDPDGFAPPPG